MVQDELLFLNDLAPWTVASYLFINFDRFFYFDWKKRISFKAFDFSLFTNYFKFLMLAMMIEVIYPYTFIYQKSFFYITTGNLLFELNFQ